MKGERGEKGRGGKEEEVENFEKEGSAYVMEGGKREVGGRKILGR